MNTPPFFKVDIHTHILPETWPDLRERYGYGGFIRLEHHKPCCARMIKDDVFFREIESNCWDPSVRIGESDACGVHVQVLSTVPVMFSYWAQPEHAYDLSIILNDHIASVIEDFPRRFAGLGTVPLQSPDLAIKELERCVNELGLSGVQIGTHINEWNLNEPQLFDFFAAASELGASVFVHPWDMMGQSQMPDYWLPWLVGMPAETSRAICSLIFGGVLERLPDLKVAFAHGGGSFPSTIGRISHGYDVRPDLCAVDNPYHPRKYLDRILVDSLVHDPETLEMLVGLLGVNNILLGSDYPFPLGEHEPGKLVESMTHWTDDDRARVLGLNALEWLGLTRSQFVTA
ncbi:MAG: amidohydrolase [Rhodothermales bacterium]|nr:amidohydrolase [Rhodothermales bacterium]